MQGVEKKMFSPLAYTIGLALARFAGYGDYGRAGALCFLFLRGKIVDKEPRVVPMAQRRVTTLR